MSKEIDEPLEGQVQVTEGGEPWILDGVEDTIDEGIPAPGAPLQQPGQQQQPAAPGQPPVQQPVPGQPIQPPAQQQGTGYEIRSGTGHVFRGATPEEALANAERFWAARNQQQAQPVQYQQPQQPQYNNRQQEPVQVRYTKEDWFKTFANDPDAAMELWFERRFGVKPEDLLDRVDSSYSTAVQVQDRIGVADFLAQNQDFPASKESGAMLIQRLARDGAEVTTWNLEVAYRQLVREGALVPVAQPAQQQVEGQPQVQQTQPQPQYQQPQYQQPQLPAQPLRGRGAPPAPPAGGGNPPPGGERLLSIDEFEALNPVQMRQYMNSPVYQQALSRSRGGGGFPRQ